MSRKWLLLTLRGALFGVLPAVMPHTDTWREVAIVFIAAALFIVGLEEGRS